MNFKHIAIVILTCAAQITKADGPCRDWQQASPVTSPPARQAYGAVYDAARDRVVLFGGLSESGPNLNDTWEWNGANWMLVHPGGPGAPTPRSTHMMVYDSVHGVCILFGGDLNGAGYLNDTWKWNGTTWTDLQVPDPKPSVRQGSGMAFDRNRGVVVLFGGRDGGYFGDTWEFNLITNSWSLRHAGDTGNISAPSPRGLQAMAYDSVRGVTTLFGGRDANDVKDETWEWDGNAWNKRNPATVPHGRTWFTMAFDDHRNVSIIYGGLNCNPSTPCSDTWEWNGVDWAESMTNHMPGARGDHAMAFDSNRKVAVMFGGQLWPTPYYHTDTWLYGPDTDCDGILDYYDNCINASNLDQADTDNDGVGDECDGCSNDPNKSAPGDCGCGVADTDSDSDGTADCNDGCPNDPNKTSPGICGCGIVDTIGFAGFLSPIGGADATGGSFTDPVRAFKLGSTIPVKFTASQCNVALLTGVHTLKAVKYSNAVDFDPAIDATPTDADTTGNQFRLTDGQWHFNLSTQSGFSTGTWKLIATLSDGSTHYVWITIKK